MNTPSRNSGRILMLRKMTMANRRRRKMLESGIALMLRNYQLAVKAGAVLEKIHGWGVRSRFAE